MTHEEIEFVIDTLETAIEWAEYADEYFQKKHGLAQDKENVSKSIELLKKLKEPKTCNSCNRWGNFYIDSSRICNLQVCGPHEKQNYTDQNFGCILHEPKDP